MSDRKLKPLVSVIVPFYGESDGLRLCLAALSDQSYPEKKLEILVIDNRSPSGLVDVAKETRNVIVLREEKSGSYAARNEGLRKCKGEIIAFTDSDCVARHDWVEKGVARLFHSDECQLVGGRVELFFKKQESPSLMEVYDCLRNFKQKDAVGKENYSVTANLMTFKKVFDDIGMFNDEWMSRGDKEWCQRAVRSGYTICYDHDMVVRHPARRSFSELLDKTRRVVGGVFNEDRQNNNVATRYFSQLLVSILPPIGRVRTLIEEEVAKGKRTQLFMLMWLMKFVHIAEYTRLVLGGRSRR